MSLYSCGGCIYLLAVFFFYSFLKPLRKTLTSSCFGETEFLDESFVTSFSTALNCSLESLATWSGPPPSDKRLKKWLNTLKVFLEVSDYSIILHVRHIVHNIQ